MTYSIVARDPDSGELGIAVQTRSFAVGAAVPWALPGVGAVATQSLTEKSYGPLGLELMSAGRSADEALRALVAADTQSDIRQVAMVDSEGRAAVHTGARCISECGHLLGDSYSVQANMMRSAGVWPAMAEAFESGAGTLARRLLAALDAAEEAGGDFRGRQAAALLVVGGERSGKPWDERVSDLRVDDHPEPLTELRRLLDLEEAYRHLRRIVGEVTAEDAQQAREAGVADDHLLWITATAAWSAGDLEEARRRFEPLLALDPRWEGGWEILATTPPPEE